MAGALPIAAGDKLRDTDGTSLDEVRRAARIHG